jgi:erythromycin esterase
VSKKVSRPLYVAMLLLAVVVLTLAACGQSAHTPRPTATINPTATPAPILTPAPPPDLQAVQSWIRQQAIPLKTTDPQASLGDLQPLQQIVGNASIVGLGEGSHDAHEFFTMTQRVLEFLVEKMGFTLFAMEWSWSTGEQINDYVVNGQGDIQAILEQQGTWIWQTQEVLDLLQWIRAYNADPSHVQKVHFAGFDCQDIASSSYDSVVQYVQGVDASQAGKVSSLYQFIRAQPSSSPLPRQAITDAQQVYDLLAGHQAAYAGRSTPQAYALALQHARVILQYTQLYVNDPLTPQCLSGGDQVRDAAMAENVAWLYANVDGGAKMVLWAHDGHIGVADRINSIESAVTMGKHLRQQFGADYVAIGTSFYAGSFDSSGSQGVQVFTEQSPPGQDSYNAALGSAGLPLYLLDLRNAPAGPISQWLAGPYPFHKVSEVYYTDNPGYDDVTVSLRTYFDVVLHVQKITAPHLLPAQ